MYRFTLSLSDYLEQYSSNRSDQNNHCPVCYEPTCTIEHVDQDLKHILRCYREDLVIRTIAEYELKYGELPSITQEFVARVNDRVTQEMVNYYKSGQTLFGL
jgi:hypothetical protein